jgi:hypothetical protein
MLLEAIALGGMTGPDGVAEMVYAALAEPLIANPGATATALITSDVPTWNAPEYTVEEVDGTDPSVA